MRILLLQNLIHLPTFGGANKANRLLLRQLAARGHTCEVVAPMTGGNWDASPEQYREFLARRGLTVLRESDEVVVLDDAGVRVHAVRGASRLPVYAARLGRECSPDATLVTMDDPGFVLLNAAYEAVGPRSVVCLVHTLSYLPFGPAAGAPSEVGARQLRRAAGVLTVSGTAEDYLRRWGGLQPVLLRLPVYGPGPFPLRGDPDEGAVTMVNPSEEKGIGTFLELARRLPDEPFLAVPTWGTTAAHRGALAELPNVRLTEPVEDIDDLLARTRVLVMPSVWLETFGMTAVEAMLRGIPVVASDIGGLPEAMLGVPHLLPPDATDAWVEVVARLLTDREHYRDISRQARRAAIDFVASTRIEDVEAYLGDVVSGRGDPGPADDEPAGDAVRRRVGELSPTQRRLLATMLAGQART
jgi:glycosyltransferase involved in cell wall biosynthesis